MAALTDQSTVEQLWRSLTSVEAGSIDVLLDTASAIVRREVPTVDADIASGALDPLLAATVVTQMIRRHLSNPELIRVRSVMDESVTMAAETMHGLKIMEHEIELLSRAGRRSTRKVGNINLLPGLAR